MKRKMICCLLCMALALSVLAGCGASTGGGETVSGAQTAESGAQAEASGKTTLRVAVNMDAPGFCPYTSGYNVASTLIIRNVYETLINMDASGNLYPGLATEWAWGENNMSVVLTLRQGVSFSNGARDWIT